MNPSRIKARCRMVGDVLMVASGALWVIAFLLVCNGLFADEPMFSYSTSRVVVEVVYYTGGGLALVGLVLAAVGRSHD